MKTDSPLAAVWVADYDSLHWGTFLKPANVQQHLPCGHRWSLSQRSAFLLRSLSPMQPAVGGPDPQILTYHSAKRANKSGRLHIKQAAQTVWNRQDGRHTVLTSSLCLCLRWFLIIAFLPKSKKPCSFHEAKSKWICLETTVQFWF